MIMIPTTLRMQKIKNRISVCKKPQDAKNKISGCQHIKKIKPSGCKKSNLKNKKSNLRMQKKNLRMQKIKSHNAKKISGCNKFNLRMQKIKSQDAKN